MDFNRLQWISIECAWMVHGFPWLSIEIWHGLRMGFNGFQLMLCCFYVFPIATLAGAYFSAEHTQIG